MDDNMQSPSPDDADRKPSPETTFSGASNTVAVCSIKRNSGDIAWEWGECRDPSNLDLVWCQLCGKRVSGGIHRLKQHLVHKKGNVSGCPKVSVEVQRKVNESMIEVKKKKARKTRINSILERHDAFFGGDANDEAEEEQEIFSGGGSWNQGQGKIMQPHSDISTSSSGVNKKRKVISNVRGPLDTFFKKQASLDKNIPCKEKLQNDAWNKIVDLLIECEIPLHAILSPSFEKMVNAIAEYGRALTAQEKLDLRPPSLTEQLQKTREFVNSIRTHWKTYGCSLMVDFWTDENGHALINFLVNCSRGTVFLKSINASKHVEDANFIVEMVNKVILDVGEENIIQIITNNGSNFKAAGRILEEQHSTMFWTPCATHCLNLILQDIGEKLPKIRSVLAEARAIVIYIYNIEEVLDMLHKLTDGEELHRSCVIRFATSYYTLKSILENRDHVQVLFTSEQWVKSKFSKSPDGKNVARIVAKNDFWDNVQFACQVLAPLVDVVRLVNTEEKPCMGFIYEAIDEAKTRIEKSLGSDMRVCTKVWDMIDKRWNDQLYHPFYAAGFYLNPAIYYKHSTEIEGNIKIKSGLYKAIDRLVPDEAEHDQIRLDLRKYRDAEGGFGLSMAIRSREKLLPGEWWISFGYCVPSLQKFAYKVLSQTSCSASPSVLIWSVFENLHSKRRNLLRQSKLKKLAFIQYNKKLELRYKERMNKDGEANDPIVLREISEDDEWVIPTDEELQGILVKEEEAHA